MNTSISSSVPWRKHFPRLMMCLHREGTNSVSFPAKNRGQLSRSLTPTTQPSPACSRSPALDSSVLSSTDPQLGLPQFSLHLTFSPTWCSSILPALTNLMTFRAGSPSCLQLSTLS